MDAPAPMTRAASASLKRLGTAPDEAPAVAKPRPAAPTPLAIAGPAPTVDAEFADDAPTSLAGMSKEELMAEMKEDMRRAMKEFHEGIERAVDKTFHRLADGIAKVEARTI